ncbi:hypothetical protein GOP47_0000841 [Adiantum capillus-veneris]|uniref:Dihydrolipoamide acetyltransferase component of pyruvate dehydrogenase complex n=1 Tax=Adiantum capillus-veneris TaxID=13818 RepID=A0A9D4VFW3_ADICA|nr:hypothetical protein GOP47_0000841 [Adiantum capillus-veneris]
MAHLQFRFCAVSPPHQVITLPALSPTMAKGNIPSWSKKEGEKVSIGEVLCLIETDKSTMEMEVMDEGFLAKILVPAGSTDVAVGQDIAIIVENEEDIAKVKNIRSSDSAAATTENRSREEDEKIFKSLEAKASTIPPRQRLGPSVRRLLIESGIDVAILKGSGPGGAVVKGDVIAAIKSGSQSKREPELKKVQKAHSSETPKTSSEPLLPPSSVSHDTLPTSQIRKVIAKRLLESKNGIPHVYLSAETVLDATLALRKELKVNYGVHVSVNDFVIKAVVSALKEVPEANAHWDENSGLVPGSSIDISIAVATERGLMTPILRNADQMSLSDISSEVKLLAGKARDGKLQPHEFQGGSFSISNLGMFEVDQFCAIINPPQACILAVGRGEPSVLWQEDPHDPTQGKPIAVTKMTLTLSADHRVVDIDIGGRFLDVLGGILRDPRKHLL